MTYYEKNKEKICLRSKKRYHEKRQDPDFMKARRESANNKPTEMKLLISARRRAYLKGLEFTISVEDITIPKYCPILKNVEIRPSKGVVAHYSPSLDRIDPEKGYIPGNVWVVSHKANSMKNNADEKTLKAFAKWVGEFYGE